MKDFIKHFTRGHDGIWTCVSLFDLKVVQGHVQVTPGTRLAPGTLFMGIDFAGMLEDGFIKLNRHASQLISQSPQDSIHSRSRPLSIAGVRAASKRLHTHTHREVLAGVTRRDVRRIGSPQTVPVIAS